VITGFTVSLDSVATGQAVAAFVLLNAAPGRLTKVAKKLSALDPVSEVYETHTYYDLLLQEGAKTMSELADIMTSKINAVIGVVGTQVMTVLNACFVQVGWL